MSISSRKTAVVTGAWSGIGAVHARPSGGAWLRSGTGGAPTPVAGGAVQGSLAQISLNIAALTHAAPRLLAH